MNSPGLELGIELGSALSTRLGTRLERLGLGLVQALGLVKLCVPGLGLSWLYSLGSELGFGLGSALGT